MSHLFWNSVEYKAKWLQHYKATALNETLAVEYKAKAINNIKIQWQVPSAIIKLFSIRISFSAALSSTIMTSGLQSTVIHVNAA